MLEKGSWTSLTSKNGLRESFNGQDPTFLDLWDEAGDREVSWPLDYSTRLFRAPTFLLAKFPNEQLAAGLFRLPSSWRLTDLLWNPEEAWLPREECIDAMFILYRDLFSITPLDGLAHMWWDLFRYFGDDADPRTANAIVRVLEQVLKLPNEDCHWGALHGLGHHGGNRRDAIIDSFLTTTAVSYELREYALRAKAGDVL